MVMAGERRLEMHSKLEPNSSSGHAVPAILISKHTMYGVSPQSKLDSLAIKVRT